MNTHNCKPNSSPERHRIWKDADLQLKLCEAYITRHKFPKHAHDYFVIGIIARGRQSFIHKGIEHHTPKGGMIVLNPEDDHTGVPVDDNGFLWQAIYPTRSLMAGIVDKLAIGKHRELIFPHVRVDDPVLIRSFSQLHRALRDDAEIIEKETILVQFIMQLITRHSNLEINPRVLSHEPWTVKKVRQFFNENLSESLTLTRIAKQLGIDRFRLTRDFNRQLGIPPYLYLECLRIRKAQRLLEKGMPPADVATEVGFTDQSHFTKRFKRQMGVTPGQYLRQ